MAAVIEKSTPTELKEFIELLHDIEGNGKRVTRSTGWRIAESLSDGPKNLPQLSRSVKRNPNTVFVKTSVLRDKWRMLREDDDGKLRLSPELRKLYRARKIELGKKKGE